MENAQQRGSARRGPFWASCSQNQLENTQERGLGPAGALLGPPGKNNKNAHEKGGQALVKENVIRKTHSKGARPAGALAGPLQKEIELENTHESGLGPAGALSGPLSEKIEQLQERGPGLPGPFLASFRRESNRKHTQARGHTLVKGNSIEKRTKGWLGPLGPLLGLL